MALHYGVLRGRVDIFKREDDLNTPHLQIKIVDGQNQAWRIAVNVLSGDQSRVVFSPRRPAAKPSCVGRTRSTCERLHSDLSNKPRRAEYFGLFPRAV